MAQKAELAAAGLPTTVAAMCGQSDVRVLVATGTTQATATLVSDFALVNSLGVGAGVRLGAAAGAPISAVLNVSSFSILVYPGVGDSLNGIAVNLPVTVPAGQLFFGIPSGKYWLAGVASGPVS